MMKKSLLIVASSLAGLLSQGDTLAWWRFSDLGEAGGATVAGMQLANCIGGGYEANACSFRNQEGPGNDSAYMPELSRPFSSHKTLKVYDPLSDAEYPAAGALSCPWGGDESGLSGGAVVPVSEELCGSSGGVQGDFTFECFFKTTEAGLGRTQRMEPIVCVPGVGGSIAAWSLMIYDRYLWCRASMYKNDGKYADKSSAYCAGAAIAADIWHHAAIVYKASEKTFELYLDYTYVSKVAFGEEDYNGKIAYKSDGYLYLGKGTLNDDRSFNGEIAEARFTSSALDVNKFLRFREYGNGDRAVEDSDTLAWYSMDDVLGYGVSLLAQNPKLNVDDGGGFCASVQTPGGANGAAVATGDLPGFGNVVRGAVRGPGGDAVFVNSGAAAFLTNGVSGSYLSVGDPQGCIGAGSFTAELFFKTAHPVSSLNDNASDSYGIIANGAFKVIVNQSTGVLLFKAMPTEGAEKHVNIGTQRVDDGKWHHLAAVYDKSTSTMKIYVDYSCAATIADLDFAAKFLGEPLTVGFSQYGGLRQEFDGWVDELRLTKRALSVGEFVAACHKVHGDILVRIPFDGDSRVEPYGLSGAQSRHVEGIESLPEMIDATRPWYVTMPGTGAAPARNGGACRFEGGKIAFPHIGELEKPGVTIEFFYRPYEKFAPWPSLLGLSGVAGNTVEMGQNGIWNFFYMGSWAVARIQFQFAYKDSEGRKISGNLSVSDEYIATADNHQTEIPGWRGANFDGKWHHVAVTLEEYVDEGGVMHTKATSYFDYAMKGQLDVVGKLYTTGKSGLVMQDSNASLERLATWDIDEVRITSSILEVSQFCRKVSVGSGIIIR